MPSNINNELKVSVPHYDLAISGRGQIQPLKCNISRKKTKQLRKANCSLFHKLNQKYCLSVLFILFSMSILKIFYNTELSCSMPRCLIELFSKLWWNEALKNWSMRAKIFMKSFKYVIALLKCRKVWKYSFEIVPTAWYKVKPVYNDHPWDSKYGAFDDK